MYVCVYVNEHVCPVPKLNYLKEWQSQITHPAPPVDTFVHRTPIRLFGTHATTLHAVAETPSKSMHEYMSL